MPEQQGGGKRRADPPRVDPVRGDLHNDGKPKQRAPPYPRAADHPQGQGEHQVQLEREHHEIQVIPRLAPHEPDAPALRIEQHLRGMVLGQRRRAEEDVDPAREQIGNERLPRPALVELAPGPRLALHRPGEQHRHDEQERRHREVQRAVQDRKQIMRQGAERRLSHRDRGDVMEEDLGDCDPPEDVERGVAPAARLRACRPGRSSVLTRSAVPRLHDIVIFVCASGG